jgi:hypothetical protein
VRLRVGRERARRARQTRVDTVIFDFRDTGANKRVTGTGCHSRISPQILHPHTVNCWAMFPGGPEQSPCQTKEHTYFPDLLIFFDCAPAGPIFRVYHFVSE